MRYAFFSDIHSNIYALESVLADISTTGVDERYALGDLVGYAPWPNEVLDRLRGEAIPVVMGNYDDGTGFGRDECGCAYTHPVEKALGEAGFAWTKAHTSDANKAWLRTLAPQIRLEVGDVRFLLVHGSPRKMNEYLYEDKPDSTFARIAADAGADVIVFGHTHRPYEKTVAGTRFINDGSAGKPKDGDPRACWALVETSSAGLTVDFRRVEYDIDAAAQGILASELPHEFANQLREARGFKA